MFSSFGFTQMIKPKHLAVCLLLCPILLRIDCGAAVIPSFSVKILSDVVQPRDRSQEQSGEEAYPKVFRNNISIQRGGLQQMRIKRDLCSDRPAAEVLEYYELKLPNRCWDDCDCRKGRYCTSHSWCHDLPKKT